MIILQILKLLFGWLFILGIAALITGDIRKGYLLALGIYTLFTLFSSGYAIIASARPSKSIKFVVVSVRAVMALVSLVFYWAIYLLIWRGDISL
jgi:hypothetical protein